MNYESEKVEKTEEIDFPWIIFKLNDSLYTVSSKTIISIVLKPDEITYVPNVPNYMTGLIHLRGNVVPLIDLKGLFKMEDTRDSDKKTEKKEMVVVFEKDNFFIGIVVDEVLSVENISSFDETEEIKKMYRDSYVKGVAKGEKDSHVLLILDEEKIMSMA